jgi:hypothetical protein
MGLEVLGMFISVVIMVATGGIVIWRASTGFSSIEQKIVVLQNRLIEIDNRIALLAVSTTDRFEKHDQLFERILGRLEVHDRSITVLETIQKRKNSGADE